MKKIIALLLSFILLLALCACGDTVSENELQEITVCLDWTPNTNHTGLFVADKLGYYEEAGLKVSIVQPPEDGAELMTASGQAQFGVSFQDTIAAAFAMEEPLAVTAVAALLQHNTSGIITRKGEGAHRPAGLAGMRYSTWNSPIEIKMMEYIMQKDGADYSTLTLLPNTVTNEAQALANKDTDAIWIFYAWAGVACELSDLEFDYFHFKDIDPVFDYYTPILVANNDFLKEQPDIAKAFLAATAKGYEYAAQNPAEAARMLIDGDTTGSLQSAEELVVASQKWIAAEYISDAPYWGYIDENRWDAFYGWLFENKLIEKDLRGFGFDAGFLAEK
ncbi:MAG: ABC transporter substrate-binding protein [Clostridia bacterium]|nr:ABC transporter substrate-binding protein [Clostridia bacterium]